MERGGQMKKLFRDEPSRWENFYLNPGLSHMGEICPPRERSFGAGNGKRDHEKEGL